MRETIRRRVVYYLWSGARNCICRTDRNRCKQKIILKLLKETWLFHSNKSFKKILEGCLGVYTYKGTDLKVHFSFSKFILHGGVSKFFQSKKVLYECLLICFSFSVLLEYLLTPFNIRILAKIWINIFFLNVLRKQLILF